MSVLTLTYDNVLSRVICAGTSLDASASLALFEVSADQIHWATVRGGAAVPITAGSASVSDYEFTPGVVNYYRISTINTGAPSFVGVAAAVTAVNAAVAPPVPSGYAQGDLLVIWAAIRDSGGGSLLTPTGWVVMLQVDNIAVFGRRAGAVGTETAPTVAVAGGVSGADVAAQMACFRNCERTPAAIDYQLNPSGQNVTYPALSAVQPNWALALYLGWKQNAWTSVTAATGATLIGSTVATAGNGESVTWDYQAMAAPVAVPTGKFTVTGGAAAISYGAAIALRAADFVTRTTASITPTMDHVWLKFPAAPYCNTIVTLTDWTEVDQASRAGTFPIVGKLYAAAVTDLASPETVTVSLYAEGLAEIAALNLILSLGNIVLLHTPPACQLGSRYAVVGTYSYARPSARSVNATFTVPLTEVSAPDGTVVGSLNSYATLLNRYGTYQNVLDANATYSAVTVLVGTPSDALVGA